MTWGFWYVLIHAGLGLVGYEHFTFTNQGGVYAIAASLVVQGWWAWEVHRVAWPRVRAEMATAKSEAERHEMKAGYRKRLWRHFVFRVSIFTLFTLLVAGLTRGSVAGG